MLTAVTLPRPGEKCAIMIVSEQAQPFGPPIAPLRPVLVSEPSSMTFSALVYFGGRVCESILVRCVIPESSSRTAAKTPAVITTRMATREIAVQPRIFDRRDRMRIIEPSGAVAPITRAAGQPICHTAD